LFELDTKLKYLLVGIITFVMVFIGVVGGFSFNKLKNNKDNLPEKLKSERNLLVVLLDDRKTNVEGMYLININPKDEIISSVAIPKSIEININDEIKPFERAYTENKTDDIIIALEKKTGIKTNNYLCVDKIFVENFYKNIGDIKCSLPMNVSFLEYSFNAGENVLDATSFANLFMYIKVNLSGDNAKKAELNLVKSAFETLCGNKVSLEKTEKILNLVKNAKGNIASYDFEDYVKIFASIKTKNVLSKEITGKYEYKEGEMFYLTDKISKDKFFK